MLSTPFHVRKTRGQKQAVKQNERGREWGGGGGDDKNKNNDSVHLIRANNDSVHLIVANNDSVHLIRASNDSVPLIRAQSVMIKMYFDLFLFSYLHCFGEKRPPTGYMIGLVLFFFCLVPAFP